jgi:hypothetical protein
MTRVVRDKYNANLEKRLTGVLASLGDLVRKRARVAAFAHIEAGEYVWALEKIANSLNKHDVPITDRERSELLDLAEVLDSDDAAVAVDLCPEVESGPEGPLHEVTAVWRRIGRGIFVIVMAVVFIVGAALGVANDKDAIDQQPVLWGTFFEQSCEPNLHGCRSFGRWVSDDGRIVKEGIYLDGSPGSDGTARAAYKPEGLINDNENNIVHVEWASGLGLWFPWLLCTFAVGATVYYARKWRQEMALAARR